MRSLPLLLCLAALPAVASPLWFTHSGRLLDASGAAVGGTHDLRVTLYDEAEAVLWRGSFADVPFADGFFSVTLGVDDTGRELEQALHRDAPAAWIGLALDGAAEDLAPRSRLGAVPEAALAGGVRVADGVLGDACVGDGRLLLDRSAQALVVCLGGSWSTIGGLACEAGKVPSPGGCRLPTSCRDLLEGAPRTPSGTWSIDPDGVGAFEVECDMLTAGGGWTRLVKSPPASSNPVWADPAGYNDLSAGSWISPAWHRLTDFTQVMDDYGGTRQGGDISACWSGQSMGAQLVKPGFTCSPAAVPALGARDTLTFNAVTTHQGCTDLRANIAYGFTIWDSGVSGTWYGLATNGYKTNNTSNCGTACVKYSASCLAANWTGATAAGSSWWVR
jgi:hypothetical protein